MSTSFRFPGTKNTENTYVAFQQDVQDAIAYAASIALATKANAAKTIFRIAQLTGALTLTIGVGSSTTPPMVGDIVQIFFSTDATGRVVTFSTGFASAGTLTLTASAGKKAFIEFVFDGTSWVETGRAIGA